MWTWLMLIMRAIEDVGSPCTQYTERPGNGGWDLLGYEQAEVPLDYYFVGRDVSNDYEGEHCCFNIRHPRLRGRKMGPGEECSALWYVYRKCPRNLKEAQKNIPADWGNILDKLQEKGLIDQNLCFKFPFFSKADHEKLKLLLDGADFEALVLTYKQIVGEMRQKIQAYVPDYLHSQVGFITDCWISDIKCAVLNEAENRKELDFAEDEKRFPYNLVMICH
jgi:hypothetical protein